jgi:hypothetical protein
MKFADIITLHGFDPSKFRLARHGLKEIDPLETFRTNPDRMMAYQAFQTKDRLGNAEYVASFAPHHGTQAILLRVFRINGKYSLQDAPRACMEMRGSDPIRSRALDWRCPVLLVFPIPSQ